MASGWGSFRVYQSQARALRTTPEGAWTGWTAALLSESAATAGVEAATAPRATSRPAVVHAIFFNMSIPFRWLKLEAGG
jgi:hypothetical protein